MAQLSDAQSKLIVETAKELRKAIDERNRSTADVIADYDEAVLAGDEKVIEIKGLVMLVMLALGDPVREVLHRYGTVADLLKATEA